MGTRCIMTFADNDSEFYVYKHWEGDPETINELIEAAKSKAWPLPRFEADEFAAAFVAVAKTGEGDVRIAQDPAKFGDMGASYLYKVTCKNGKLSVTSRPA